MPESDWMIPKREHNEPDATKRQKDFIRRLGGDAVAGNEPFWVEPVKETQIAELGMRQASKVIEMMWSYHRGMGGGYPSLNTEARRLIAHPETTDDWENPADRPLPSEKFEQAAIYGWLIWLAALVLIGLIGLILG